jgi:hypothetical protein
VAILGAARATIRAMGGTCRWAGLACGAAAVLLLLMIAASASAGAQTFKWTDGIGSGGPEPGNGVWSQPSNWSSGTAPSGGPVNLDFPVEACVAPFYGCPPAEDDVAGLEVGTLAIANRIVRIPSAPAGPPAPPPPHEPPPATYALKGTQTLRLREGIDVETTSEGEGEGLESAGGTSVAMPLVLTGPNNWVVGRKAGGGEELPGAALNLIGSLSGEEPLTVLLGAGDSLQIEAPAEVGPIAIEGGGYMTFGTPSGGGDLNGLDGARVGLHDVSLSGAGTTGPLTVDGGSLDVGFPGNAGTVTVNGELALTAGTVVYMEEPSRVTGLPARVLARSAALGNATLYIGEGCPAPGTSFTLVEGREGVSGLFRGSDGAPISSGQTLAPSPSGCGPGSPAPPLRIDYSATAVTATALAPPSEPAPSDPAPAPKPPSPAPPTPSGGVAGFTASARAVLARDLAAAGHAARIRRLLRHGGETIAVEAPSAGTFVFTWTTRPRHGAAVALATGTLHIAAAGRGRLLIKLTRRGRALLAHSSHLRVTVTEAFTAPALPSLVLAGSVTLRR